MGIYDKQNLFCDDQDFAGETTGTSVYSTNNLQVSPGDFGQGENILLDVIVTEAFTNIVSLQVALVTDSALPIDASSVVLYETPAILLADLVAGYKFAMKGIPPGCLKHIALKFNLVGGTDPDAGQIHAGLTPDTQDSDPSF
jgi:hypothetical protein